MSFLEGLTNKLSSALTVSENSKDNLNYSDFENISNKVDTSATRNYVEEGFSRTDPYFTDIKSIEILMQEPSATVLIKKKMFSSLANNFRPDYMSKDEKLFYKACNALFYNKAQQISALERLSKIEKIIDKNETLTDSFMPSIISLVDSLTANDSVVGTTSLFGGNNGLKDLFSITDRIRKLYAFTKPSQFTKWIDSPTAMFSGVYGEGTGVFEITNFTDFSTAVGNSLGKGRADFNIVDPYKASFITEYDIEKAISDATNLFYNKKTFNFSESQINESIGTYKAKLNSLRSKRRVSEIDVSINPDSSIGEKVVARLTNGQKIIFTQNSSKALGSLFSFSLSNKSSEVEVSGAYLIDGEILGNQGLNTKAEDVNVFESGSFLYNKTSELELFQNLISSIYLKLTLTNNSQNTFQINNQLTNYARRKMNFYFLGRNIIQPMDEVRIFISSKTKLDSNVSSGLREAFAGQNFIEKFSSTVYDIQNQFNAIFNASQNLDLQAEKSIYVGQSFPNQLWNMIRGYFVNDKEGPCVFAGVVGSSNLSGSPGSYKLSVNCSDNSSYFNNGQVNFNPGVDNFNGYIYDPLTPFESKFDQVSTNLTNQIPQLLEENRIILNNAGKGILKYKSGPGAGQLATQDNFIQDVSIDPRTGAKKQVYYGPDGLVYNWKQGIGVFTQYGNSISLNDPSTVGNQNVYNNPFAGQDVMNVISLAITGKPYNFINYWKAVQNLEGYSRDPYNNTDAAYSYSNSLKQDLSKNNMLWGNFIPFKTLVIDELSYAKVLNAERSILRTVDQLEDNINKLKDIDNGLYLFGLSGIGSGTDTFAKATILSAQAQAINNDVEVLKNNLLQDDVSNYGLKIVGSDVTFDADQFLSQEDPNKSLNQSNVRRSLRRKTNQLTRRMPWAVRANEDKNLLIVDDSYDKDYDIAAYDKALQSNLSTLYSNGFTTVGENITSAANLLNLEVFCDTQGHIRVQPPQYNKIPSSIFDKLIQEKRMYGKSIYPEFIDNMFTNQLDAFKTKLEVSEDNIRLLSAMMDLADDSSISIFINSFLNSGAGPTFSFLTDNNGHLIQYQDLLKQSLPEAIENQNFQAIQNQSNSSRSFFTSANRYDTLSQFMKPEYRSKFTDVSSVFASDRINRINNRIQSKTGQKVNLDNYILASDPGLIKNVIPARKSIDIFKITKELGDRLAERQRTVKQFYESLKNSIETNSIFDNTTQNRLFTPGINNKAVPESLEHMIEDENFDDYGFGSGSRYVIRNYQIKDFSITEEAPNYTGVTVSGSFNLYEESRNQGPAELNSLPAGGNGLTSATAIDYDLMRMYGFKSVSNVNVPFLSDPQSQCAPYASMLLSIARKNILRANVTIVGNEYYQPSEVVYIEDIGLLFYIESVSHRFQFGSSFTTTLSLTYGHAPGDYIPNVLDMVGKVIYKNQDAKDFINYRQQNSYNEQNIGIIILDPNSSSVFKLKSDSDEFVSRYSQANAKTINDIIYTTAYQLDINNIKDQNLKVTIELRTYYDSSTPTPDQLIKLKEEVSQILTGTKQVFKESASGEIKITLPKEFIITDSSSEINLDDMEDTRSPSNKATSSARDISNDNSSYTSSSKFKDNSDKIREGLINYMIDCWIKFEYTGKQ